MKIDLNDIMPVGFAAIRLGVSGQCLHQLVQNGVVLTLPVHGKRWVSLSQCRALGIGSRKARLMAQEEAS